MTFSEAYAIHGPDVEAIALELGITPPEADRLINAEMNRRYAERREAKALKASFYNRDYNLRVRSDLREIRGGRAS